MTAEENPKKSIPVMIVTSAQNSSGVVAAMCASGVGENGQILYELKNEDLGSPNWDELRKNLQDSGVLANLRNKVMTAKLPEREPVRIMSGVSDGIPPVREYMSNGECSASISRELFMKRVTHVSVIGAMHGTLQAAVEGNEEARKLLDKITEPDYIHYDPMSGVCSLVSSPEEATGRVIPDAADRLIKFLDDMSSQRREAKTGYYGPSTASKKLIDELPQGRRAMFTQRLFDVTNRSSYITTTGMGSNDIMMRSTTTTQSKKAKREAKKPVKPGQNYLKIGKR